MDMPQYIHDNTDDKISHAAFISAYLASKGASTTELDLLFGQTFRTIRRSVARKALPGGITESCG
jgi:hypothetical protein